MIIVYYTYIPYRNTLTHTSTHMRTHSHTHKHTSAKKYREEHARSALTTSTHTHTASAIVDRCSCAFVQMLAMYVCVFVYV